MSPAPILWLTGRLPYPTHSGDALYSLSLIEAASALAPVQVIGRLRQHIDQPADLPILPDIVWHPLPVMPRSRAASLLGRAPSESHLLIGPDYRARLDHVLRTGPSPCRIVCDQAAPLVLRTYLQARMPGVPLVYTAHNVEMQVRMQAARDAAPNRLMGMPLRLDAAKHARQERHMLRDAAGVTAISAEDAALFATYGARNVHVAPALYSGPRHVAARALGTTAREVLLIGSFGWISKQQNLRRFIKAAAPALAQAAITLRVVGDVPSALLEQMRTLAPEVIFEGRVQDTQPYLQRARLGVVPEMLGGGFKLKLLDYAFNRIPIVGVRAGMAGFASAEGAGWLGADTPDDLAGLIVQVIDDLPTLDQLQRQAFDAVDATNRRSTLITALARALDFEQAQT